MRANHAIRGYRSRDQARSFCGFSDRTRWHDRCSYPDCMYSLGRVLGQGGNATVYEAVDRKGAKVAIKVLHEMDKDQAARLAREARTTALIRHPNV